MSFSDITAIIRKLLGLLPEKSTPLKPKPLVTPTDLGWDESPTPTDARKKQN